MSNNITLLDKVRTKILLKYPFFASLLYDAKMVPVDNPHISRIGVTADMTIYYNEGWFTGLTLDEGVFVVCHELLHPLLHHFTRQGARNRRRWNIAGDEVINDWLITEKIGAQVPDIIIAPGAKAETTEERYRKLEEQAKSKKGKGKGQGDAGAGDGEGEPGGIGDDIIDHNHKSGLGGQKPDAAKAKEIEARIRTVASKAALAAKARGNMPGSLAELVEGIIESKTPWHEILRHMIDSYVRGSKTWLRANRRYASGGFYLPSVGRDPAMGHLVIGRDISGSVSEQEAAHFTGHCAAIIEAVVPEKVTYLQWDTRVAHVDEYEPDAYPPKFSFYRGGGTHAPCAFDWVLEQDVSPCVMVMLTDGETDFGQDPGYPVIWVISNKRITAPWGVTIHFDMEA